MTHLKPKEILNGTINSAAEKAQGSFRKLLILSILAGAFIALAGGPIWPDFTFWQNQRPQVSER